MSHPLLFFFPDASREHLKPSDTLSKKAFIEDVRVVTDPFFDRPRFGINETLTEGGFLKIQVELENLTRGPSMEYLLSGLIRIEPHSIDHTVYHVRELLAGKPSFCKLLLRSGQ